jgi:hypothetical protein
MPYGETVLAVITGIGLAAACGFSIFVPLLLLNLASTYGYIHLTSGFEWIGGYYATIAFALATVLEITAYYVPWLDNVMDAIASPVSIVAGAIATASIMTGMPPSLKWMVAIIAGGGIAGLLHGSTAALRAKSSLFTGGTGNMIVSTLEFLGSIITSVLAIILPVIGLTLVAVVAVYLLFKTGCIFFRKMRTKHDQQQNNAAGGIKDEKK